MHVILQNFCSRRGTHVILLASFSLYEDAQKLLILRRCFSQYHKLTSAHMKKPAKKVQKTS